MTFGSVVALDGPRKTERRTHLEEGGADRHHAFVGDRSQADKAGMDIYQNKEVSVSTRGRRKRAGKVDRYVVERLVRGNRR